MDTLLRLLFMLVVAIVAADGVLLMTGKHGDAVNRLHVAVGNPCRVDVQRFKAAHHRAGGVVLFCIAGYVLLKALQII